jgi:ATP-dependent DNA helicase RecG
MGAVREATLPSQIDIWRACETETQRLEFKEARLQYDNEHLFEYCVALGNEGGGHLLLGVSNKLPRPVVGTAAFRNPVKMEEKLFNTLGFRVDIEEVQHPDGRVLVFHIPSRAKGTAFHRDGKYLMRSGESLVPMSEDQLRRIFAEGKPNWLEEYAVTGLSLEQLFGRLAIEDYFALLPLPFPSNPTSAADRLVVDGLIDEINGQYSVKRLAALLLARNLDHFPELERKKSRIVIYNGTSKLEPKLERMAYRGYAVGFKGLLRFVGEQLPQNEIVENAIRREVKLVPEGVVREVIANALIHQEFELSGTSVMIEIYPDRFEVTNPGTPQIPTDRFIDGCQSRNERLAMTMRKLGLCEEKGSGIDRVVEAAEIFQLPAPDFRSGFQSTTTVIYGPRGFDQMSRDDRVRACYQHCVLRYVVSQQMTNQSLRERFKLPESKSAIVSQIIAATMEAGLIKVDEKAGGSRKFARYIPKWV